MKSIGDQINPKLYKEPLHAQRRSGSRPQPAAADWGCNYSAPENAAVTVQCHISHAPKLTNKSRLLYSSFSSCDHIKTSFLNAVQTAVIALI